MVSLWFFSILNIFVKRAIWLIIISEIQPTENMKIILTNKLNVDFYDDINAKNGLVENQIKK